MLARAGREDALEASPHGLDVDLEQQEEPLQLSKEPVDEYPFMDEWVADQEERATLFRLRILSRDVRVNEPLSYELTTEVAAKLLAAMLPTGVDLTGDAGGGLE